MSDLEKKIEKKSRIPHVFVLLIIITLCCGILTWILPTGVFDRAPNEAGRMLVVPGSYHKVDSSPVGPFAMIVALYSGITDAAEIVVFVFLSFAGISIMIQTGAFNSMIASLLRLLKGNSRVIVIPLFITLFSIAASTIGMFEEILPFIPIFVGFAIAMGYDAIVGMAMVAIGPAIGYSAAAINPFTVGVAQGIAELPPLSGAWYRIICHVVLVAVASIYMIRYSLILQKAPQKSLVYGDDFKEFSFDPSTLDKQPFGIREKLVLLTFIGGIAAVVLGSFLLGWYFKELAAVFILMGVISGFIMGWGPSNLARRASASFGEIATAAMVIGFARAILVVMRQGNIIDTLVYYMSLPLNYLPRWLVAEAMLVFQTLLNFLIPSGSGQAATSMPVMAPLSDILGINRQIAVLAFQFGDALTNILWPTAFMPVICGVARIRVDKWVKWFLPLFGLLFLTQGVLLAIAMIINYS